MDEVEEWFRSKLEPPDENDCWKWKGRTGRGDFGYHRFRGEAMQAHRLAYTILVGPVPPNLRVTHLAEIGCASRRCCNPDHLAVVTPQEHQRRLAAAARQRRREDRPARASAYCVWQHELGPEDLCYDPQGRPRCRTCAKLQGHPWHRNIQPPEKR